MFSFAGARTRELEQAKSGTVRRGLEDRFRWLDKPSPVCGFAGKYIRFHSGANSFMPTGKVSDVYPKWALYSEPDEMFDVLKDARRLDYLIRLRIDEYTRRVISELATT